MAFSENIRAFRKKKGFSQAEMSDWLEKKGYPISQATIANYELGKVKPTAETLKKLAGFFEVSMDELYK